MARLSPYTDVLAHSWVIPLIRAKHTSPELEIHSQREILL